MREDIDNAAFFGGKLFLLFQSCGAKRLPFNHAFGSPNFLLVVSFAFQNPGVQSSASLALAVMSENLSSRDVVGKLGKC